MAHRSRIISSMLRARQEKLQSPQNSSPIVQEALTRHTEAHRGFDLARAGILDLIDAEIPRAEHLLEDLYSVYYPPTRPGGLGVRDEPSHEPESN